MTAFITYDFLQKINLYYKDNQINLKFNNLSYHKKNLQETITIHKDIN
jgi:hypothetical protein